MISTSIDYLNAKLVPPWAYKVLAGLWLLSYTALVHAASLAQVVGSFDYQSLGAAAMIAFFGGAARTILTLASQQFLVLAAIREAIRDSVVAMIGGMATYLVIMAANAVYPTDALLTNWVQVALIGLAGYSKGKWRDVIGSLISDYLTRQRNKLGGGPPPSDPPPSSIRAPLEGK